MAAVGPGAVARRWRRAGIRSAALLGVLVAASLIASAQALAIGQRGHVFSFHFGSFSHPSGVAVDSATGDVYVADRQKKRVDEFEPVLEGGELVAEKLLRELKVSSPEAVAVDDCVNGSSPCTTAQDPSVGDLYVLGAGHTISKFNPAGELIDTIKGFAVGAAKETKLAGVEGIAVDSSGHLFVVQYERQIYRFNDEASNEGEAELLAPFQQRVEPGFAVDSKDNVYVGETKTALEGSLQQALLEELEEEFRGGRTAAGENTELGSIAKLDGATNEILIPALDYELATAVAVNPSDVAGNEVDEHDDVYILNEAGFGAEKAATVAELGPEEGEHETGEVIQRFGTPGLHEGDAVAVDSATGAVYVADTGSGDVDVFALEPPSAPTLEGVAAASSPTTAGLQTLSAKVDPDGAETEYRFEYGGSPCSTPGACTKTSPTTIAKGFGDQDVAVELVGLAAGTYYYTVIAENAKGEVQSAEQTFTIAQPVGVLPDGRAWEMVSPAHKAGAEPEAIRKEGGLVQASASGDAITFSADGPMPAETAPEGNRSPEPTQILSTREPGKDEWASQDLTTPNETGAGPAPGAREEYQLFSGDLALALVSPYPGTHSRFAQPPLSPLLGGEVQGQQENTIYLRDQAQLLPAESELESYEKAAQNGGEMTPENPGYLPLVTDSNGPGPGFGRQITGANGIVPEGDTPDLSHVVFRSENEKLKGLWEWSGGEDQLISILPNGERAEGEVQEAYLGGSLGTFHQPNNVRHAISENGKRIFWTHEQTLPEQEVQLEVREVGETPTPETLRLDTVQSGSGKGGKANAVFQAANEDGSKVFFTDDRRLTADSGAEEGRPDLYVAELEIAGGHLQIKRLKDLSALGDEAADVLVLQGKGGGVLGTSDDGSYVYFVADGALAPGATRGHCDSTETGKRRPPGTTCNLYVRHFDEQSGEWEPTKLVAVLSAEDSPDWDSYEEASLAYITARVSPNGQYLAFMSERRLTGYDNEDASSKSPGERLDEEVFLYDAQPEHEHLLCASCDPNGARPTGVFDAGLTAGGKGEGLGLVVDRAEIWSQHARAGTNETPSKDDHWLAGSIPGWTNVGAEFAPYQSRYLSNTGRLFFNSADPLVPVRTPSRTETIGGAEQQVGVENVYEYEPDSEGGCTSAGGCVGLISSGESERESAFLDASVSGDDVFFLTAQRLVPGDVDDNFDVYDARVCGASCPEAPAAAPESCESEACQGSYTPTPGTQALGTAVFSGPGNLVQPKQEVLPAKTVVPPTKKPLTRAQKLAKALKACKRHKQRAARVACEKQARKKYGPAKAKAKKSPSKGKGR